MAVPTSYTESDFKDYLHAELGPVAQALGWEVASGQYDEPLNDALFGIGATVISGVSSDDINGFRILGKLETWRKVLHHVSGDFDFSDEGASLSRSQVHDMAIDVIEKLEESASNAGVTTNATQQVATGIVDHTENPYGTNEDT